jgi:hypothetical protein
MTTATAVGDVEMRIAKVVGLATDEEQSQCVVLEADARRAGDSPTAARLRRALAACPMTVGTVELSGNAAEAPLLSVAAESPLPRNRMRSILTR